MKVPPPLLLLLDVQHLEKVPLLGPVKMAYSLFVLISCEPCLMTSLQVSSLAMFNLHCPGHLQGPATTQPAW